MAGCQRPERSCGSSTVIGAPSGFSDQLGRMYAPTASQHLHTKRAANQDSGTVSGSASTLRTVSCVHALQEANNERASSQRTSPSVVSGQDGSSGFNSFTVARNASRRRLQGGLYVWLPLAIGTPGNFRVAFDTGEDLHLVAVVAGLRGTTEQMHFSAARRARGPIFDAKRTPLPHANWASALDGWLGCDHEAPLSLTPRQNYCTAIAMKLFNIAHNRMTHYGRSPSTFRSSRTAHLGGQARR
jgi:hypothetical protein